MNRPPECPTCSSEDICWDWEVEEYYCASCHHEFTEQHDPIFSNDKCDDDD